MSTRHNSKYICEHKMSSLNNNWHHAQVSSMAYCVILSIAYDVEIL